MEVISKIESMFHDENSDIFIRLNEILELIDQIKDKCIYNSKSNYKGTYVSLVMEDMTIYLSYINDIRTNTICHVTLQLLIGNIILSYSSSIEVKSIFSYNPTQARVSHRSLDGHGANRHDNHENNRLGYTPRTHNIYYYQLSDERKYEELNNMIANPCIRIALYGDGIQEIPKPEKIIKHHTKSARN